VSEEYKQKEATATHLRLLAGHTGEIRHTSGHTHVVMGRRVSERGFEPRRSPFNTGWYAADKRVLQKTADTPPETW
jgi:hypothetical protein